MRIIFDRKDKKSKPLRYTKIMVHIEVAIVLALINIAYILISRYGSTFFA